MEVICRVSGGPLGATQYRGYDALGQVEYNVCCMTWWDVMQGGLVNFVVGRRIIMP
jgi:hypothetical protein